LLTIVTYSYLIFPLLFLFLKAKLRERFILLLAIYGLAFFSLIFFDYLIPKNSRIYIQAFYTFLEYSFFTYFIWINIRSKQFKKFIILISFLFIVFQTFYVTTTPLKRLDSIPIGIETIFIFIYIFFFLFEYSKNIKDSFIYNHYCFWVSVGILIYLGGSFFFNISATHLTKDEAYKFIILTYIAEILKNFLFAFSLFIYSKYPVNRIQNIQRKIPNLDMI
jgi:hypothetical protein